MKAIGCYQLPSVACHVCGLIPELPFRTLRDKKQQMHPTNANCIVCVGGVSQNLSCKHLATLAPIVLPTVPTVLARLTSCGHAQHNPHVSRPGPSQVTVCSRPWCVLLQMCGMKQVNPRKSPGLNVAWNVV